MNDVVQQFLTQLGGMTGFQQRFNAFGQNFRQQNGNISPQQKVQQMLNNGQMSQEDFNRISHMADMIMGRR